MIHVHPTLYSNLIQLEKVKRDYQLVEFITRTKHLLISANKNVRNLPKKNVIQHIDGNNGGDAA